MPDTAEHRQRAGFGTGYVLGLWTALVIVAASIGLRIVTS